MFEVRSCLASGKELGVEAGDIPITLREPRETVLASEAAKGLTGLAALSGALRASGGASPFPLPSILPPPSFRADIEAYRRRLQP